jgi:hypothetical protein
LCLVGLSALGCSSKETTSSSNIKTGGIAALIDVYADTDDTATVHVALKIAGSSSNAYVLLEGSDKLIATADGETKTLTARDAGIYEANFSGVGADTEISVTLERPDDITASGNSGTLPAPFTLDDPTPKLSRKDDDLTVTWAPADTGDPVRAVFDGSCIFNFDDDISDTGSYAVPKGTLMSTGGDKPKTCDITLNMSRSRTGTADSKFDPESYFRLFQRRSASFTSNP